MKEIIECAGGEVDMEHFFNLICRCFSNVTLDIANDVTLVVESMNIIVAFHWGKLIHCPHAHKASVACDCNLLSC